tara:strand:+ start:738 stop:1505 length:768 start_codon:yes stop_codon:yes gene_type:complete
MLLSKPETNFKISKNLKLNYNTFSLNFAHSDISGFNVCPMANKINDNESNPKKSNCSSVCVGANGFASIHNSVIESRIKKTLSYFLDKKEFLLQLSYEVDKAVKLSIKKDLKPSFRLNAYSDIRWEKDIVKDGKNIFQLFPDCDFYDYTKIPNRKIPKNYQLTYSHHNPDFLGTIQALKRGFNVAMVFEKLPKFIKIDGVKYGVLDGDKSDLRLNESYKGSNCIIGLKFKGSKKKLQEAVIDGFCISKNNESLIN